MSEGNHVISCLSETVSTIGNPYFIYSNSPYDPTIYLDWIYILICVSNVMYRWCPIMIYSWTHIQYCLCPTRVYLFLCSFSVHVEYETCIDAYNPYDISKHILE